MDPEQLQIVLGYAALVSVASLVLRGVKPGWTRMRIALIAGGSLPLLGLVSSVFAFVSWVNAPPLPDDTDHHAMAVIESLILIILSMICFVVGIVVSLVVTMIVRARQADGR